MAYFRGDIKSKELQMDTTIHVIIPEDLEGKGRNNLKVLYLFHGQSDNASAWIRNTRLEYYARKYNIAIVLPEVQRSFYTNMEFGLNYFSYVSEELPKICNNLFHFSGKRENTFVAGLSMGGYGSLKCALSRPDVFSKCGAFSSAIDMNRRFETNDSNYAKELKGVFGDEIKPQDDLFKLAEKLLTEKNEIFPKLFITCGTKDFLYEENIMFKKFLKSKKIDFKYVEWEGFHEWGFWDESIKLMLENFLF